MRRALTLLLALATIASAAGCGEDGIEPTERDESPGLPATSPAEQPGDAPGGDAAVTTLTELETVLQEDARLNLVRTGGGEELGPQAGVPFLEHVRYEESRTGLELDVWVLGDVAAARRARANLSDSEEIQEGGRLARGCNVVALYAPQTVGSAVARRVTTVLGDLRC